MAEMFYVLEDEHDGEGWFRPLGNIEFYKDEAEEFVRGQHYAYLADVETLGYMGEEPDFKIVSVRDFKKGVA